MISSLLFLTFPSTLLSLSWVLGPEQLQPYPSPGPYQFPDAAIALLGDGVGGRLMFWSDGKTYRVAGGNGSGLFPHGAPTPSTPVLGNGPNNTYDANGNWFL